MARFEALPGMEMPTQGKDPDLLHVQQLEAVMNWIDAHVMSVEPVPVENAQTVMDTLEPVKVENVIDKTIKGKRK